VRKIKAIYVKDEDIDGWNTILQAACKFLSLDPDAYGLRLGNLMERIIQYVKDRTKDFDDYIPCRRRKCDERHTQKLLSSIGLLINEACLNKASTSRNSWRRRYQQ
jgi:hypothetical protein